MAIDNVMYRLNKIIEIKYFIIAFSEQECENWIKGLRYMVTDTIASPYPSDIERWLRKEYYAMENARFI